jgi:hypothetical protein
MSERSTSVKSCFQVSPEDNVATMLCNIGAGDEVTVQGPGSIRRLAAREAIRFGHKIALEHILKGDPIVKYGVPIGFATASAQPGEWIHLHNCRSKVNERSSGFDPTTGDARDTTYV